MEKEMLDRFLDLASALSPENLTCDGELSAAESNRRYKQLMKEWRALEHQFGRKVDEDEIWGIYI